MTNAKIAVLGERESVVGFTALGLSVFPAESEQEARRILQTLLRHSDEYAIIYVTEKYAVPFSGEIEKYKDQVTPAIIMIPGRDGTGGLGQKALKDAVERAVGANII